MRNNLAISEKLGYLKIKKGTIISVKDALKLPSKNITILCTGAQGESDAVLMKIMNREHKNLRIQKGDTVVFSSSVIAGNEFTVQNLKDNLTKQTDIMSKTNSIIESKFNEQNEILAAHSDKLAEISENQIKHLVDHGIYPVRTVGQNGIKR